MKTEEVAVFLNQYVVMEHGDDSIAGRLVSLRVDEYAPNLAIIAMVDYGFGADITRPEFTIRAAKPEEVEHTRSLPASLT
jgi:hypothetical protein